MKQIARISIMTAAFALTSVAAAHGPVAEQAAKAVSKATELYLKNEKQNDFQSVTAELTGDEQFTVRIQTKTGPAANYWCGLDMEAKPVKWGCKETRSR